MTGVDWPEETALLRDALVQTLSVDEGIIRVVNDCIIALRAATSNPTACVLCAGTGLNCAVRDGKGGEFVFGYYIADEDQGGMALANRVLRAVFDAHSGRGEPTALMERCLSLTRCDSVDALLRKTVNRELSKAEWNQIPIIAEEEALRGDTVSANILSIFGRDEASYAVAAIRRMGLQTQVLDVVLSGSVFKCRAPMLRESVESVIHSAAPCARIIESAWEPVVGAVLLALDAIGAQDTAPIQANLERDTRRFGMVRSTDRADIVRG
ncbi:MAG: hypothetical protein IJ048_07885 [Clostridia bacterium]|nr:hypothetical protein [Clostridia bacterium]